MDMKSGSIINELRLKELFCDAIIKVGNSEIPVHKVILCSYVQYFRVLFEKWSDPEQRVFVINGVSSKNMKQIIKFIYTGFISLNMSNIYDLIIAADMFNIAGLVQKGFDYLETQLSPKNCLNVWQLTNTCPFPKVGQEACRFIAVNFEQVMLSDEFLQLRVQELAYLLGRDDLNTIQESTVYESAMRWISYKPELRQEHITALLSNVRLIRISPDYLRLRVLADDLVKTNHESRSMVEDAIKKKDHIFTIGPQSWFSRPQPPAPILLVTGGWSGSGPSDVIEAFDFTNYSWHSFPFKLGSKLAYHGTAFLDGYLYVVGGFDGKRYFNSMSRCHPVTYTWQERPAMHYKRGYLCVTVLNGCFYAIGGFDGKSRLNSAEYYEPDKQQWTLIAPMHDKRSDASCTTLNNKIYICGGINKINILKNAECYDPETNQWTLIAPMSRFRTGLGVIACFDHVYVVGGFDGTNHLDSAEKYNPLTNTWVSIPLLTNPRSDFGIERIENKLFVVGGFDGTEITPEIECYNSTKVQWSEVWTEVWPEPRCSMGCCVVSGMHHCG